ncbi:MAG: insulinase family protein [Clostridia bacterium]|nr:insulinase family protein [Clostridia bacterium]
MTTIKTYESGLRFIFTQVNNPISAFNLVVGVGAQNESYEQEGLSHFLEHLIFKSTTNRTVEEINDQLSYIGANHNAATYKDKTCFHFKVPKQNFEKGLEIFSDILQNGRFLPQEIDPERAVVLEEMEMRNDNPGTILFSKIDNEFFAGTPRGHLTIGRKEVIQNVTPKQIVAYKNKHYTPNNMIVSVVADMTFEQAEQLIQKYFPTYFKGKAKPTTQNRVPFDINIKNNYFSYDKDDNQVNLDIAIKGVGMFDEKFYVQQVFCSLLGGDCSARLYKELREKLGLAYSTWCSEDVKSDCGYLHLYIGTTDAKLEQAIVGMKKILFDIAKNGVTEKELNKIKNLLKNSFVYREETSESICHGNANSLFKRDTKIIEFEEYCQNIDKVTTKDIQDFAKQVFVENNFVVGVVGKNIDIKRLKVYETCLKKKNTQKKQTQKTTQTEIESTQNQQ